MDVTAALKDLWGRCYGAGAVTVGIVAPQELKVLAGWLEDAFGGMRAGPLVADAVSVGDGCGGMRSGSVAAEAGSLGDGFGGMRDGSVAAVAAVAPVAAEAGGLPGGAEQGGSAHAGAMQAMGEQQGPAAQTGNGGTSHACQGAGMHAAELAADNGHGGVEGSGAVADSQHRSTLNGTAARTHSSAYSPDGGSSRANSGSGCGSSRSDRDGLGGSSRGNGCRYSLDVCGPYELGRLVHVAPMRELRQLDMLWYLPFGTMRYSRWAMVAAAIGMVSCT